MNAIRRGEAEVSGLATAAVVAVNGMGQDGYGGCAGTYPGSNWGDGFITAPDTVAQYGLSDPSFFFQ